MVYQCNTSGPLRFRHIPQTHPPSSTPMPTPHTCSSFAKSELQSLCQCVTITCIAFQSRCTIACTFSNRQPVLLLILPSDRFLVHDRLDYLQVLQIAEFLLTMFFFSRKDKLQFSFLSFQAVLFQPPTMCLCLSRKIRAQ